MSAVLGYEPVPDEETSERIWLEQPGTHTVSSNCRDELLAAIHELKPRDGARLYVLRADVGSLGEGERQRLLGRIGFVPADGGLLSSLNGWENMTLPVAYHQPHRIPGLLEEVEALLAELGGVDEAVLRKLPEDMTLYEKRLVAYVRALLEKPELLLVEPMDAGLGPTKRKRTARFANAYHARCPGGTFVTLQA
jgi:ABC-type transporter Mla maintaining outer membrane lipid asymmetry ATPase subunit MlaF